MEQPQFRAARPTCRACYGCSAASRTTPSWNLVLLISRLTVLWVPAIEPGIYENRLIVEERGGRTKILPLPHHNNGRPGAGWRTRPVSAAQTCCPHPYGAGQQDQILKVRPFRQDLLAATERRDLLFCAARPGVRFHAGAAATYRFRPAPNWGRVQSAGAAIVRNDSRTRRGSINSWDFGYMRPG